VKIFAVVLLAAAAWAAGFGYGRWYAKPHTAAPVQRKPLYWVDAMHPWYKSDRPGIAPDCNMELVPVYPGEEAQYQQRASGVVQVTPHQEQLMGVTYGIAEYENATATLRAAARVAIDETRVAKVQAKLAGWIDQVFVDFTGKLVQQGDPLLSVYSPEALATEQEYLLAIRAQHVSHENPLHEMRDSTDGLVAAARKRLELWDISGTQIDEIARTGQTIKDLTLYSPISGFVMERSAFPKQRVTPETPLYTVADLSTVWVMADVYEYEAANIRMNQAASLKLDYLPGRTFRGRVSYIQPAVDPATRTLKVRLEFPNSGYALKPDMYGQVEFATGGGRRLTVPQSAVLNSGDRQIVFLDRGNSAFEQREVKIGQQFGDRVEVVSGLKAGERIVTSGNFLLDSESRLK